MMPDPTEAPQASRRPFRPHQKRLVLALLLGCGACGTTIVETTEQNVQPFAPLPVYAEWWSQLQVCSARVGPLDRVEWFTADGLTQNGGLVLAKWEPPHRITVLANQIETESVVKHEMLHDLLDGDPSHQAPAWNACGV